MTWKQRDRWIPALLGLHLMAGMASAQLGRAMAVGDTTSEVEASEDSREPSPPPVEALADELALSSTTDPETSGGRVTFRMAADEVELAAQSALADVSQQALFDVLNAWNGTDFDYDSFVDRSLVYPADHRALLLLDGGAREHDAWTVPFYEFGIRPEDGDLRDPAEFEELRRFPTLYARFLNLVRGEAAAERVEAARAESQGRPGSIDTGHLESERAALGRQILELKAKHPYAFRPLAPGEPAPFSSRVATGGSSVRDHAVPLGRSTDVPLWVYDGLTRGWWITHAGLLEEIGAIAVTSQLFDAGDPDLAPLENAVLTYLRDNESALSLGGGYDSSAWRDYAGRVDTVELRTAVSVRDQVWGPRVGSRAGGERLKVLAQDGPWIEVATQAGERIGWVSAPVTRGFDANGVEIPPRTTGTSFSGVGPTSPPAGSD